MKNNFVYYALAAGIEATSMAKLLQFCIADPKGVMSVGQESHGIEEKNN